MKMRPMSIFESNESSGEVSLKGSFELDCNIGSISNLEIEEIAKSIVRGGWAASVTSKSESSFKRAQDNDKGKDFFGKNFLGVEIRDAKLLGFLSHPRVWK